MAFGQRKKSSYSWGLVVMDRLSSFLSIERELAAANFARLERFYEQPFERLSTDQVAIVGVDGWQFIANGSNEWERQYLGEKVLDDSGLAAWQEAFARRMAGAATIGARFAHLVVPEKQSYLADARWPDGRRASGPRPIQQMQALITSGLIYPSEKLKAESWRAEISFRGNSHWCASGAWFCFVELMELVFPKLEFDFKTVPLERKRWRHDLLRKFVGEPVYEGVICFSRVATVVYDNRLHATTGAQVGNHYVLANASAPYQMAVVVFGDSYSFDCGFSDLLAVFFGQVHFVWDTKVDFNYCRHVNAQLVLVESAERFLIRPHVQNVLSE